MRKLLVATAGALAIAVFVAAPANTYVQKDLNPPSGGEATLTVQYANGANPGCKGTAFSSDVADLAYTLDLGSCTWVSATHYYQPVGGTYEFKVVAGLQPTLSQTPVNRNLNWSRHAIWV